MTQTAEQISRMAGLAGNSGAGKPPKYTVPLIRFDGNRGEFRKISIGPDGGNIETPLEKPVNFVILKKRRLLSSFSPTASYFTNEYESPKEIVNLYKNVAKTITFEAADIPTTLREKYQSIRTHEVLYVLHGGEVCKFEVKGGSLGNYYTYQKELTDESLHSFQVTTSCGSIEAKNETGFKYFQVTFTPVALEASLDEVESHMLEVDTNTKKIDDYFKAKAVENANKSEVAYNDQGFEDTPEAQIGY